MILNQAPVREARHSKLIHRKPQALPRLQQTPPARAHKIGVTHKIGVRSCHPTLIVDHY